MYAMTVPGETVKQADRQPRKRGCLFYVRRGLMWFGIIVVALVVLGMAYQVVAVELDKRNYPPPGQLYDVNGHQMHIYCSGSGSPTVILQAGGLADSLWWYRVQNQLAQQTQVCSFDRPGMGWSEPADGPREALTMIGELHTLLEAAGISGPFVMAGHSHGAVLTRIYATQYPEDVIGIVLVDSSILLPKHFADQAAFETWKSSFGGLDAIVGAMIRVGVYRLTAATPFQNAGYPPDIAAELGALQSRNQILDTDVAEFKDGMWALTESSATAENLGDLPMVVLWAPESWIAADTVLEEAPAARAEISTYSSNSLTRSIEGADHGSILGSVASASPGWVDRLPGARGDSHAR